MYLGTQLEASIMHAFIMCSCLHLEVVVVVTVVTLKHGLLVYIVNYMSPWPRMMRR